MTGQRARLLGGAILALLLLGYFFRGVDLQALGAALRGARPLPLAGLVVVTLLAYCVRSYRLGELLRPLGRVGFADLFSATMVGFATGLLIPRAQEIVRPWLISRRHPIPTSAGFAAVVLERLVDLLTVLALFALYLFVLPAPLAETDGPALRSARVSGVVTTAVALAVLLFLLGMHANPARVERVAGALLAYAPRRLAEAGLRLLHSFAGGLAVLRAPLSHLAAIGLQSLVIWLLVAIGFQLTNAAFGIQLPFHANFLLIAFLVVGVAIPTPGMVGGFHAFYQLALADVYSVPRATAAAAAVVAHALGNLPVLLCGLLLLRREGMSFGRVAEISGKDAELMEVRP